MGIVESSFLERASRAVARAGRSIGTPRRPNRAGAGAGMGMALTASFMGILVVRSMADAAELSGTGDGSQPADAASSSMSMADPSVEGWPAPQIVGASGPLANVAAGSVLMSGAFIDPVALASLSGDAHFDQWVTDSQASLPPSQALASLPGTAVGPGTIQISLGSMAGIPTAPAGTGNDTGEDAGPIGDVIVGTDDDETIVGTESNDFLDGGGGDDVIQGLGGDDTLQGGAGNDMLDGGSGDDDLLGEEGDDVLVGGEGDDTLDGGSGDDQLLGGGGADHLDGGQGNDTLDGGTGNDDLIGGTGDDSIQIDRPGDLVIEDPWGPAFGGNDTLVVAPDFGAQLEKAFPTLAKGGVGTFMIGESVLGSVPSGANSFKVQVAPNVENVRLTGAEAHDVVGDRGPNTIEGNDGANMIWGGDDDDRLRGGGGDDRLYGGDGDDLLMGDVGNDWLNGGDGADQLYGGAGDDVFVLGLAEDRHAIIFDHEGSNRVLLQGGGPDALTASLAGDDLHLAYSGHEIAVIRGYANSPESFAGVDFGSGEVAPLDGFLAASEPPAPPLQDLLAGFLEPSDSAGQVEETGGVLPGSTEPIGLAALDYAIALSAHFAGADLWVGGDESGASPARATEDHRLVEGR